MAQNNVATMRPQPGHELAGAESTRGTLCFAPTVDIFETDTELLLYADLPGVDPQQIDLRYEKGELTLTAKAARGQRPGQLLVGEFEEGDYLRVFRVNETIDAARIEAEYKNGVLLVHLPKVEKVRPKQVRIKTS